MSETQTHDALPPPEAPRFTPEQAETLRRLEALAPDVLAAVEAKDLARAKPLFNERGAIARAALNTLDFGDAEEVAFAFARALIDQCTAVEQAVVKAIGQYGKTMMPTDTNHAPLPEVLDAYERVAGFTGFYSLHQDSVFNENAGGKYVALMDRYRHNLRYDLLQAVGAPGDDSATSAAIIERAPGLAASLLDQAHGLSNRFDLDDAFQKKLLEQLVDRGEIDVFVHMNAEILEKDIPPRVRAAIFDVWCQVGRPEVVIVRGRFRDEWAAATALQKRQLFGSIRLPLMNTFTIASLIPVFSEMMDEGVLKRTDIPDFFRKSLIEVFIGSYTAANLDMDALEALWRKFEFNEKEKDEIFNEIARGTAQGIGFVRLSEQVGLPSREVVKKAYHVLISRAEVNDLRRLNGLSGIPFEFAPSDITAAYAAIMQTISSMRFKGALIRKLRELIPDHAAPAEVLQEWYRKKLVSDAQNIREFVEATGVRPTPETVAQAYESVVLRSGADRYTRRYSTTDLIAEIFHETNERPSDAVLNAHQEECLKRGDYDIVHQLRNLFGEVPPVSPETLQTTYVKLVQAGEGERLRRFFEAFPDFKGAVPEETKATGALSIFKLGVRRDVAERLGAFQVFVGAPSPDVVQEGYAILVSGRRHDVIPSVARLTGVEPNWPTIGRSFPLTDLRQVASLGETGEVELLKLRDHIPWHPAIRRLRKIQGFVEHAEHDPWRKELQPLLDGLVEEKVAIEQSAEDGELFADFVQEFGALNMPKLCRVFLEFKRHPQLDGVSPDVANWFSEATGKNVVRLRNGEAGINELRRFKRRVQEELLADKIPSGLDTVLGAEVMNALRTTTRWGQQGQIKDLIQTWQTTFNVATEEGHPEWVTVPEGYVEQRFDLATAAATENDPSAQRAIVAVLDSPEVKRAILENKRLMDIERGWSYARFLQWWQDTKTDIIAGLHEKEEKARSRLADAPERAKKGIEMSMQQTQEAARVLKEITLDEHPTRAEYGAVLQKLVALRHPDVEPLIHGLASKHLAVTLAETGWTEAYGQLRSSFIGRETRVPLAADFLLQFMKEHYLHLLQEEHQTYHEPFSPELRDKLELLWGLKKKDQAGMRIIAAAEEMRKIKEGAFRGTGKTESVAFVPVRGLLRVFAGDVGDACYTSQHDELARGEFPGITAVMMVTNRGEAQERLAGSALFVETTASDGRKTLVVRANNPRENLLGKVDADALVKATIDYAIEVATVRGIDVVGVCMDGVSQSATNRAKVFEYYKKQFTGRDRLNLTNTPDTNFNGYDITQNTVAAVWERSPPLE